MSAFITPGTVAGLLAMLAALSNAFHMPALGVFLSDPATAAQATSALVAIIALAAGFMKGVRH